MNKIELEQRLRNENIDRNSYWLDSGLPNEAHCLGKNGDIWEVYYSERGRKTGLKTFNTEEEACIYFFDWLIKTRRA